MRLTQKIKEQACIRLLHFHPKKAIARELGISHGAVRDWSIFLAHGNFAWVTQPYIGQRKELLAGAVSYWLAEYPIGYSDVARQFGLRPAGLFQAIRQRLDKLPLPLRPQRLRFWDTASRPVLGAFQMEIRRLADIPADRPLTLPERKALLRELKDARDRLLCAESLLEVAVETCRDELKKKELQRQLELTKKALASYGCAASST